MSEELSAKACGYLPASLTVERITCTDPYANLARERAWMDALHPSELVLLLWQNADTVVIGRNQNPWKECAVKRFTDEGGRIARRLSGGGAVYHDLGNLNFSFIAHRGCYDVARQMRIICEAVRRFGIDAGVSGRNDLEVAGRKFSGNAFFNVSGVYCQHGTLMAQVDYARMGEVLSPDKKKLESKGVDSVRSRVQNLHDLAPTLTCESLAAAIESAAGKVLGVEIGRARGRLDEKAIENIRAKLSSWEWIYGRTARFSHVFSERFSWGNAELNVEVSDGAISAARLYSDALDADFIEIMEAALIGLRYTAADCVRALQMLEIENDERARMCSDIVCLVNNNIG